MDAIPGAVAWIKATGISPINWIIPCVPIQVDASVIADGVSVDEPSGIGVIEPMPQQAQAVPTPLLTGLPICIVAPLTTKAVERVGARLRRSPSSLRIEHRRAQHTPAPADLLGRAPLRVKRVEPLVAQVVTRPHAVGPKVVDRRQVAAPVQLAHRLVAIVQEVRACPRRVLLPRTQTVSIVAAG